MAMAPYTPAPLSNTLTIGVLLRWDLQEGRERSLVPVDSWAYPLGDL